MRRPMTTEELFNKIRDILKDKNKLPDILDYGLATNNPVPIRTYQFDLKSRGSIWDYGLNILLAVSDVQMVLVLLRCISVVMVTIL